MSLLLCRMEPVVHPFEVPELGVRLYSSQELCYVIYENPLLVIDDFVDERLIQFVRDDLNMEFLAGKLDNWKKSNENPDNLLLLILTECQYYTSAEVNHYRQLLIQLRKKHPSRLTKERPAYFFGKKQYGRAISLYEKLLEGKRDNVVDEDFLSRVWSCLGACYARMFQFEKAYHAYDRAFFYNGRDPEILERIYSLKAMYPDLVLDERYQSIFQARDTKGWDEKIEAARKNSRESEAVRELDELFMKDPEKRMEGASRLVRQWKQEYRSMM